MELSSCDPGGSDQLADFGLEHTGAAKVHPESAGLSPTLSHPDILFIQPAVPKLPSGSNQGLASQKCGPVRHAGDTSVVSHQANQES